MTDLNSDEPLVEWNRLNKENAEQDVVSALYQSMSETSPIVEKFSVWLLAGTGATAALLITQIKSILPNLSVEGYKACLVMLVVSAISGFVAKYYSLRCEIQFKMQSKFLELVKPVFEKHEEDEVKIANYATQKGLVLSTDIDFINIMNEFSRPFPFWVRWLIAQKVKKTSGDRQAGYHAGVKAYASQIRWSFFQAILFLVFILSAAWYCNAI